MIIERNLGPNHPYTANILGNLGGIYNEIGEYRKAIDLLEKAVTINTNVLSERHPSVAFNLNNLGWSWESLGYYKKALSLYEQAESIFIEKLGQKHANTLTAQDSIKRVRKLLAK